MPPTPARPRAVFLDALSLGPVDLGPLEPWAELEAWPVTAPEQRLERLAGATVAITNKIPLDGALLRQLPPSGWRDALERVTYLSVHRDH